MHNAMAFNQMKICRQQSVFFFFITHIISPKAVGVTFSMNYLVTPVYYQSYEAGIDWTQLTRPGLS